MTYLLKFYDSGETEATVRDARTHRVSVRVSRGPSRRSGPRIKRRLTIVHSVSRHHRVSSAAVGARRPRCGAGQFASVERETGVESGRAATVAPDRYNKWDNDITGTPGSRARPGPNVVIITFGSLARSLDVSPPFLPPPSRILPSRVSSRTTRNAFLRRERNASPKLRARGREDRYFGRLRNGQ